MCHKAIEEESYPFIFLLKNHQGMEKPQTQHPGVFSPGLLVSWQTNLETMINPLVNSKSALQAAEAKTESPSGDSTLGQPNSSSSSRIRLTCLVVFNHQKGLSMATEEPNEAETEMSLQVTDHKLM